MEVRVSPPNACADHRRHLTHSVSCGEYDVWHLAFPLSTASGLPLAQSDRAQTSARMITATATKLLCWLSAWGYGTRSELVGRSVNECL